MKTITVTVRDLEKFLSKPEGSLGDRKTLSSPQDLLTVLKSDSTILPASFHFDELPKDIRPSLYTVHGNLMQRVPVQVIWKQLNDITKQEKTCGVDVMPTTSGNTYRSSFVSGVASLIEVLERAYPHKMPIELKAGGKFYRCDNRKESEKITRAIESGSAVDQRMAVGVLRKLLVA